MALRLNVGNLSNVSDQYPVIPEGVYEVQVAELKMETAQSGNPMVTLKANVVNHPEHMAHSLFDRIVLTDKALWKLKQFCEAVGLTWDDAGVDVEPAIGRTVMVRVVQELYQPEGKEPRRTNRIDEYLKRG